MHNPDSGVEEIVVSYGCNHTLDFLHILYSIMHNSCDSRHREKKDPSSWRESPHLTTAILEFSQDSLGLKLLAPLQFV